MNKKIVAILVLATVLRLVNLNQSFWLDEASQAVLASQTVQQIWFGRSGDFQPPLFYFLAHFWIYFGKSEVWLRILPIIFGILGVYFLIKMARDIFPYHKNSGLVAGLLLAISPFHIYYSQEFRMYSLVVLLSILAMWSLYRKHWSLFIFNCLLLYAHYSTILLIASQFLYVLAIRRKDLKYFLFQCSLSLLLYLPWLPQLIRQLHSGINIDNYLPGWRSVLSLPIIKATPEIFFKLIAGRINLFPRIAYAIYIMFVLLTAGFALVLAKKDKSYFLIWIFAPIILSIGLSFSIPQTEPFRLIFILPALTLMFTQACLKYPRLFLTIFIYIGIFGNVMYFTRPRLQREQWRQAIGFVSSQEGLVAVKFSDKFAPFSWYSPNLQVVGLVPHFPASESSVFPKVQMLNNQNIYLFDYLSGLSDPNNVVENALKQNGYKNLSVRDFEGVGFVKHFQKL